MERERTMQRDDSPLSQKAIRFTMVGAAALLGGLLVLVLLWYDKDGISSDSLLRKAVYCIGTALLLGLLFAAFLN